MRREYNAFTASVADEVAKLRATQAEAVAHQMALDEESLTRLKAEKDSGKVRACILHLRPSLRCPQSPAFMANSCAQPLCSTICVCMLSHLALPLTCAAKKLHKVGE